MKKILLMLLCAALLLTGCGNTAAENLTNVGSAGSTAELTEEAPAEGRSSDEIAEAAESSKSSENGQTEGDFVVPEIDASVAADEEFTSSVFAMDTYMSLKAYGPGAQEALSLITEDIAALDRSLSVTSEGSEIHAVNAAAGSAVAVSAQTRSLISRSVALGDTCGNALDISLYPVLTAWGFTTEEYQIPTENTITELLRHVNDDEILVDEEAGTVTIPEGMQIDLGSVVKGYAGDRAVTALEACGVSSALINLGGSTIRLLGTKLDGSLWKVAVQDPEDPDGYAGVLAVSDCAVDTSGGYERYFEDDAGNVYWHILDPATGYPARSGVISATIVSPDSFTGDGLSTACFVMGLEDTIAYWRENGGFEFVLITDENEIYASEGIADSFTPAGSYENKTVHVVPFEDSGE